jgi:hypothetical protein
MTTNTKRSGIKKITALALAIILTMSSVAGGVLSSAAGSSASFRVTATDAYSGVVYEGGVMNIELKSATNVRTIRLAGCIDQSQPQNGFTDWTASGPQSSWGYQVSFTVYLITIPANTTGTMTVTVCARNNSSRKLVINLTVGAGGIPGLDDDTPIDKELCFDGDCWILIKKVTVNGQKYAQLLKKNIDLNYYTRFRELGDRTLLYEGSSLQNKFTQMYSSYAVPTILKQNAVKADLSQELSMPTTVKASTLSSYKDVIYPLSLTEATDWAKIKQSAGAQSPKLKTGVYCWWLRTGYVPTNHWWVVLGFVSCTDGYLSYQPLHNGTGGEAGGHNYYCRPAIWVNY